MSLNRTKSKGRRMQRRSCRQCGKQFEATLSLFLRDFWTGDGRSKSCPECYAKLDDSARPYAQAQTKTLDGGSISPPEAGPSGLGGWLILAFIALFAYPLQFVSVVIPFFITVRKYGFDAVAAQDPSWLHLMEWNLATSGTLALLSLITMPLFLLKRRSVPPLMLTWFALSFTVGIINFAYKAVTAPTGSPPLMITQPIFSLIITTLWLRYFLNSARVKNTFVRPGDPGDPAPIVV